MNEDLGELIDLFEEDQGDGIVWWGGWGGILCGWHSANCIRAAHRKELMIGAVDGIRNLNPSESTIDEYHDEVIGEGVFPRIPDDFRAGDHEDEYALRCDECSATIRESLLMHYEAVTNVWTVLETYGLMYDGAKTYSTIRAAKAHMEKSISHRWFYYGLPTYNDLDYAKIWQPGDFFACGPDGYEIRIT